ncbi:flagellar assembly peptidoglycan hydrolase FlgJ [Leeia aquatica]|uniref:Peptidoglycan hydrolase FlgJ n=1 Tax=Leeia aquatica TaxID=2725557 RepID=A0A847SA95_9NEIS|nr:flagellar assembly peptidoglycan hydrolase FlgJ [Leeia aquatica]NLR75805.1 flagellar assembly peptidoglycan hydrolase FlgJ [Leeia aquatica]
MTLTLSSTHRNPTQALASDVQALSGLRRDARQGSQEALRGAAQQFEALMLQQMLKSMRASVQESDLWSSSDSRLFQGMQDEQMALEMSKGKGFGLADALLRQMLPTDTLSAAMPAERAVQRFAPQYAGHGRLPTAQYAAEQGSKAAPATQTSTVASIRAASPAQAEDRVARFLQQVGDGLTSAASQLGVSPMLVAAHAALESGWGRREIKDAAGRNSFNLFGIKAGPEWQGKVAETTTTEYVGGQAVKRVERFRAYDSYADAFKDYARMLASSERYQGVLNRGNDAVGFAQALQRGGYATDPHYAGKLARVASHPGLRAIQLAG